jgi:hypothetical protein
MKYRKTSTPVEAFQMTKERRLDNSEWPIWLHRAWQLPLVAVGSLFCSDDGCLIGEVYTPLFTNTGDGQGIRKVCWGDWIVRGPADRIFLVEQGMFSVTYEPVEETLE